MGQGNPEDILASIKCLNQGSLIQKVQPDCKQWVDADYS